ncbi:hypothetical protein COW36_05020 [bacterium (Candidatus Blackallbacteria) CG17_big_fil_post_rev_8_21_14_2_50_48_46]|uniref:Uncharacterized protein n=1 Tax=bacterium (Candidatus Blackallbacteria) CG17_big_fil_post_rev_8_21_14_2_50_48_46 TaxID=2014261 RepID=A0A2M7G974_9BACT|nr:MAG: hypothetical protein COW64_03925 [bacterium (Candidatus Blackallbacteria) CG18_big_fil_WC_8_21_14_2_50_49_26]PIW18658.1 MAG: hypothetical protein COW36_05020 [bacterium (Candidatus Blackallbacteria) CG17_big_fil_post_rev_8_21_14_2_50_48_46]PIW46356.1 MAG: hypothetical protein COW20_15660 [bacterium (Candidatus Blackallbacteria) CG13_big_fil_rev_8_21_14_2_50_49_14]
MPSADPESSSLSLNVIVLAPEWEKVLGSALQPTPLGMELQLNAALHQQLNIALERALDYCWQEGFYRTALLVDPRIRRHLHRLIEKKFPRLPVISYLEVAPGYQLNILQTLNLEV